jgi:manganese transport protein
MEGFLQWRISPAVRRVVTRLVSLVPVIAVTCSMGEAGVNSLLILSQVILSFQLPFALVPLMLLTSDRRKMGAAFANNCATMVVGWAIVVVITCLNIYMIVTSFLPNGTP